MENNELQFLIFFKVILNNLLESVSVPITRIKKEKHKWEEDEEEPVDPGVHFLSLFFKEISSGGRLWGRGPCKMNIVG